MKARKALKFNKEKPSNYGKIKISSDNKWTQGAQSLEKTSQITHG